MINHNYIVEELCEQKDIKDNSCQGKCHLNKQIKNQTELPAEKSQLIKIDYLKIPHLFYCLSNQLFIDANNFHLHKKTTEKELLAFFKPPLPPPKLV